MNILSSRYLHHLTKPGKQKLEDIEELDEEEETSWQEGNEENQNEDPEQSEDADKEDNSEPELKPAEVVANLIVDWMKNHGVDETVTHLAGDSTASNTGWKKGVIAWIERKIGRKVDWRVCMLHTNELDLRRLIEMLDGKTDSKTGWSGYLGKLLAKVMEMRPNFNFKKIDLGADLIELPEEVIKDLSTDQHLLYKRVKAVRSGHLPRDVALRKAGKIVHSRWLNTATTFVEMWQSHHGLKGDLLDRLETIVTYIVTVYCPMWFNIKVRHSWLEGPRHVLTELGLFSLLSSEVQQILLPTLKRSAWNSHSESVLQTMLCSKNKSERDFAVSTILKIRGRNKLGNKKPRPRKLPELNIEATTLENMINWKAAKEPILACDLTKAELEEIRNTPMVVPYYSLHTQGIERAVKEVTEASETVYGFERRDGMIRTRAENRKLMPALNSKKCLENLLTSSV